MVTKAKSSWKLKTVWVETSCGCRRVRRALDCQECVRRTRERWVGSRVVRWTLRSHCEVRSTPRFQEGTDVSDFRKRCAGEGNSAWSWRRRVRVTIDQGRRTGQDGVVRLINWELWTVYVSNRDSENSDWKTATAKQRLTHNSDHVISDCQNSDSHTSATNQNGGRFHSDQEKQRLPENWANSVKCSEQFFASCSSLTFCGVYLGGYDAPKRCFLIDFNFYL